MAQIHILVEDSLIKIGGWTAFERNEIRIKNNLFLPNNVQPQPLNLCPFTISKLSLPSGSLHIKPKLLAYANKRGSEQIFRGIKRFDEIGFLGDNRCLKIFQNNFS